MFKTSRLLVALLVSSLTTLGQSEEGGNATGVPELYDNVTDVPAVIGTGSNGAGCPTLYADDFCEREANRYCYVDAEKGETCGTCLPGFVEWQAKCLNEKQIDIVLFLEEYAPEFLEPMSMEERGALLLKAIAFITAHQTRNPPPPYELAINQFSADSPEDIKGRLGFRSELGSDGLVAVSRRSRQPTRLLQGTPPSSIDHTALGHVTSVKDQGRCGCCWAVTAAGMIEGATAVQTGYLQSLSFQQMISCDKNNFGCNGGNLGYAMGYALDNKFDGIARLGDYPYTDYKGSTTEKCQTSGSPSVEVEKAEVVVDFFDDFNFEKRMELMKQAVSKQPIGIVIRSNCQTISNYKRGVLTEDGDCACTSPECGDHAVLLVGYDDDADPPYWKLKNSWSENWGEEGYFRIAQTAKGQFGLFGVVLHGAVPTSAFNLTDAALDDEYSTPSTAAPAIGSSWWCTLFATTVVVGGAMAMV